MANPIVISDTKHWKLSNTVEGTSTINNLFLSEKTISIPDFRLVSYNVTLVFSVLRTHFNTSMKILVPLISTWRMHPVCDSVWPNIWVVSRLLISNISSIKVKLEIMNVEQTVITKKIQFLNCIHYIIVTILYSQLPLIFVISS
ncbi:putative orfan [Tupanvirus soda lake]|uniref:Orfan n=2 Tax=Tupanvirus TaxID=2094720 RepID=A0AC62AAZ2_9VIRU|nr:putative orfan [Tupanvirus soda lake]QKU34941.1 putative orfan [Tupanvirus soda lake]